MENLKFKNFEILESKADKQGNLNITAYAAVFGNVDSDGDVIVQGAFTNTLQKRAGRIAFCYQHNIWNPVGQIKQIEEDDTGLFVNVMISAANPEIQTKIKEGILKELSIGYRVVNSHTEVKDGVEINMLDEVELFEISLVTIASNPLARVVGMKSEQRRDYLEKEFDRVLAIVRNDNISFEIEKLKSLVFSVPAPPESEPQKMTKDEILNCLTNHS